LFARLRADYFANHPTAMLEISGGRQARKEAFLEERSVTITGWTKPIGETVEIQYERVK
jgi:hypothetical protein